MKCLKICWGLVFCLLASFAVAGEELELSSDELQKFNSIISNVKKYYYKDIDKIKLFSHAISGMLADLDPHSAYLDQGDFKNLRMETTGLFGGIGVEIFPENGFLRVLTPLDDTPASRAGIQAGDLIMQVDGKFVRNLNFKDAINMMRGKPGSKINLTIVRSKQNKPLVFNLRREVIKIKTVKERILDGVYGYLRVALFQEPTALDVERAVKKLEQGAGKSGLRGVILDLRNNPGGLLESSIQVADYFLDGDNLKKEGLIVYTKGRVEETKIIAKATSGDILRGKPLVVLINEGSASAAEIVAGALQDHGRAIIVGTRSFGKGSVQTVIPIDDSSAIKITTATYYTPLGRSIQIRGIEPDVYVESLRVVEDNDGIPRVDEGALLGAIQNGESKNSNSKNSSGAVSNYQQPANANIKLAQEDYQVYEALQILKSHSIVRRGK